MGARMQMLVDGEWLDVGEQVVEFVLDTEPPAPEPEPMPTSISMTFDVTEESRVTLAEMIRRLEHEALLARWRTRWWLTHPYNPKPPNGC